MGPDEGAGDGGEASIPAAVPLCCAAAVLRCRLHSKLKVLNPFASFENVAALGDDGRIGCVRWPRLGSSRCWLICAPQNAFDRIGESGQYRRCAEERPEFGEPWSDSEL